MRQFFTIIEGYVAEKLGNLVQFGILHHKKNKLNFLRVAWLGHPRGKLCVAKEPFFLVPQGSPYPEWVRTVHPENGYLLQTGQGAMLMSCTWPEFRDLESADRASMVTFLFWCNDGFYEYKRFLTDWDGKVPFYML